MLQKPRLSLPFSTGRHLVASAPLVHQGRAYLAFTGSDDELVSLRLSDGAEMWRRQTDHVIEPEAAIGDVVLCGSGVQVRAISIAGDEVWRRDAEVNTWEVWGQHVVLANGPVEIVDAQTGQTIETMALPFTPKVSMLAGSVYLGFGRVDHEVVAMDLPRRERRWTRDLAPVLAEVPSSPGERDVAARSTGPGVFILKYRSHLFAFSVGTGERLWRRPIHSLMVPAITADRVYTWNQPAHRSPAHLVCFDANTGDVVFDRDLSPYAPSFSQHMQMYKPLVHPRAVVLATQQGMLCACSPEDGALLWLYQHKRAIFTPSLVDDRVLVPTANGLLLEFPVAPGGAIGSR